MIFFVQKGGKNVKTLYLINVIIFKIEIISK